jgi:putative transposase
VAFTCELIRQLPASNGHTSTVGVDVGVRQLAVLSTGEQIANPRPLERAQRKRGRLQRQWQRQECQRIATGNRHPSRRQQQTHRRITRVDARAANIRRDGLHKLTSRLVQEHGGVVVEQLNVQGMLRNRRLARAIADAGFGQLRRLLDYKCRWRGVRLVVADPFYPSSKTCSACGAVRAKLHLGERVFRCQQCGLELDRDLNAARNLAKLVAGPIVGDSERLEVPAVAGSGPETRNARGADVRPGLAGQTAMNREAGTGRRPDETGTAGAEAPATRTAATR